MSWLKDLHEVLSKKLAATSSPDEVKARLRKALTTLNRYKARYGAVPQGPNPPHKPEPPATPAKQPEPPVTPAGPDPMPAKTKKFLLMDLD